MVKVEINCKDGKFQIDLNIVKSFNYLWENLEDENGLKINFLKTRKKNIKKIIAFSEYSLDFKCSKIERPILKNNFNQIRISDFEKKLFADSGLFEIMEIVEFSKNFGVDGMEDLGCAKIVCLLKGKSEEELKVILKVN